jgi:hypothetical protein
LKALDIGIDAAGMTRVTGRGRVRAVFRRVLYLDLPGGLVALATPGVPRGPLHIRVRQLPPSVSTGRAVIVDAETLRLADHIFTLDAPVWSPELPSPASFATARGVAREWLPSTVPALGLGIAPTARLLDGAVSTLRRGDLDTLADLVVGRGPGLTPAGDDLLAGVLLVARGTWDRASAPRLLPRPVATGDIARAFLRSAAEGRCIEPVHDLLTALACADRHAVGSSLALLARFGSSSGTALAYGIRLALLELATSGPCPEPLGQLAWEIAGSDPRRHVGKQWGFRCPAQRAACQAVSERPEERTWRRKG